MILDACQERGNGEMDAKGLARAGRGDWGGGEPGQEGGGHREGETARGRKAMGKGQRGGGHGEAGGGDGETERGEKKGQEEGGFHRWI